jgi:outer membrane protein assembly factor BamD (BamD/ComL family)
MLTAKSLHTMYSEGGELTPTILTDFFGIMNLPESVLNNKNEFMKRVQLLDGLYKGLYLMDVSIRELEKNRQENTLDKMIHDNYKNKSSGYYKKFCEQNIPIGNTNILFTEC